MIYRKRERVCQNVFQLSLRQTFGTPSSLIAMVLALRSLLLFKRFREGVRSILLSCPTQFVGHIVHSEAQRGAVRQLLVCQKVACIVNAIHCKFLHVAVGTTILRSFNRHSLAIFQVQTHRTEKRSTQHILICTRTDGMSGRCPHHRNSRRDWHCTYAP